MSRSYRKPKAFIAGGRNTEYYRERNRSTRTKNKRVMNKLSKYKNSEIGYDNLESIDEDFSNMNFILNKKNPSFDTWCEPTDGSYLAKEEDFSDDVWKENYFKKLQRK